MVRPVLAVLTLTLIGAAAQADWFLAPRCAENFRAESFAIGQGAGYTETAEQPDFLDSACYNEGLDSGKQLAKTHVGQKKPCDTAWKTGERQGLEAELPVVEGPSDCFQAGFNYGQAKLISGARHGEGAIVGDLCVSLYAKGKRDGARGEAIEADYDNKGNFCYLAGYNDALLFQ